MKQDDALGQIRRLLDEERFAQAQELLARLTQKSLDDPQSVCEMLDFLKSAVVAVKARRAHFLEELQTLRQQHVYFSSIATPPAHTVDVTG